MVLLLELFSSKAGTSQFQRRNFSVPAEELLGSSGGTFTFHRWKSNFPPKECLDEAGSGADPV